ncbi:hypothetical protein D9757_012247 [Collybiopsis confluens]|uniref:C2H2-type domain-containing protein n=1 Tax=Collybiopsis confluens TaxID=2823264 RepID=A0A8H5G5H2_9AGAR|nr:hypothetical protein D9757_012247 [Collybiopsis confluens]
MPASRPTSSHEKPKRFTCTWPGCTKTLAYRETLDRHLKAHSGERIYVCSLCKREFTDPSSCSRHRAEVHSQMGYYHCPFGCCFSRKRKYDMVTHIRNQHHTSKNQRPSSKQIESSGPQRVEPPTPLAPPTVPDSVPPQCELTQEEFVQLAYVASLLSETDEQFVGSLSQPVYPYCEPQEWNIYPNHSAVSPQPSLDSASTSASSSVSSPSSSSPLIVPSSLPSTLDSSEGVMTIPSGYESVYPHPHPPSQVTAVPFHQQYPYTSFASPALSSDSSFASPSPFWPPSAAPSPAPVVLADAELASPMSCYSMSSSSSSPSPSPASFLSYDSPVLLSSPPSNRDIDVGMMLQDLRLSPYMANDSSSVRVYRDDVGVPKAAFSQGRTTKIVSRNRSDLNAFLLNFQV